MKLTPQRSLGMEILIPTPESVAEFDQCANKQGAHLEYAVAEGIYRSVLPKIRAALFERLETETGIKRKVVDTKTVGSGDDAKTVDILEKDSIYFKRICTELSVEPSHFQPIANEIASEVGFDLSTSRGTGGRVTAADKRNAEKVLAAIADGKSTFDRVIENLVGRNPGLEIVREDDGSITAENLAAALKVERLRLEQEAAGGVL